MKKRKNTEQSTTSPRGADSKPLLKNQLPPIVKDERGESTISIAPLTFVEFLSPVSSRLALFVVEAVYPRVRVVKLLLLSPGKDIAR